LGPDKSGFLNFIFTALWLISILGGLQLLQFFYPKILMWCLSNKKKFLSIPATLILLALCIWFGFNTIFGFVGKGFDQLSINIRTTKVWSSLSHTFPGIGEEFMPSLDEGSFLLMPTSMPHSGIEQNKEVLQQLDMLVGQIPEVDQTVGKLGRVESALDPAPIFMYENIINYKPEYIVNKKGYNERFAVNENDEYLLDVWVDTVFKTTLGSKSMNSFAFFEKDSLNRRNIIYNKTEKVFRIEDKETPEWLKSKFSILFENRIADLLIPNKDGKYFRNWRPHIKSPDDIWDEIARVTNIPGVTSAPKLQPIETRLVMLQTGMRAPMGIKVFGPDLNTIQEFGMQLESILKEVPSIKSEAVFADRIVGKPYLHINIDRAAIARYGLNIEDVQQTIETSVGGMIVSQTVQGRERFSIRVRYPRELRDDPEQLKKIYVATPSGVQVPLQELVEIEYHKGPQMIKSENTFLLGYVLFDKKEGYAEVKVVEEAERFIEQKIKNRDLIIPEGVTYKFSGSYENQIRASKKFSYIIPLTVIIIFLILYFQFKRVTTTLFVFSGVFVSFSGGFLFIWLYGMDGFADFSIMGTNIRELFQMKQINLSVAVWVGFISLIGISTDDGVIISTYIDQLFKKNTPTTLKEVRSIVLEAGKKRIRPALMTIGTTLIALLPVLTSSGRGSDIALPMAIPTYGGMLIGIITVFVVPTLYCWREELKLKKQGQ
jgi:Cu(I)/Ag(I) efflux system membrane protein CusA/SilA